MNDDQKTFLASAIVVGTGALWGVYWLPVRRLAEAGLPGAWGTLAAVLVAAVLLLPGALKHRGELRNASPVALFYTALGGAAFVLYSVGLIYGRVAIIILLFYLTPVWSTVIDRYIRGQRSTVSRLLAIVLGLVGLVVMLGANGEVPMPRNLGEWLALLSGILWSISSTGIRYKSGLGAIAAGFVFVLGACAGAFFLIPFLAPLPESLALGPVIGWGIATGSLWWAVFMTALMWATARLEPARVGILLMSEILVGAFSGAMLAGEHLDRAEMAGGALVLTAAILEIWSNRKKPM